MEHYASVPKLQHQKDWQASDIEEHSIGFPPLDSTVRSEDKEAEAWTSNTDQIWEKCHKYQLVKRLINGEEID